MALLPIVAFISLLAVACVGAPARFVNSDAAKWLQKFGYLPEGDISNVGLTEYLAAIETMQRNYQIPVTGNIDLFTDIEMMIPRCGVPDISTDGEDGGLSGRVRRYVKSQRKWEKKFVSYRITSFTSDISITAQEAVARQAFQVWDQVIPITLYELPTSSPDKPDIEVGFLTGSHGDNSPFDSQTIAHAFNPGTQNPIQGDIHINDALAFSAPPDRNGFNLLAVLIHEIGHTLGLEHSYDRTSVMFEKYGEQTWLSNDDIAGVQDIYGSSSTPQTPPPMKRERPTSYDAIYNRDGIIYLIKGTKVFRQYPSGSYGDDIPLSSLWPGSPGGVDSATVLDDKIIYVHGNRIWKYRKSSHSVSVFEERLTNINLPDKIDHVFAVESEYCLYFFEGYNYYRLCDGSLVAEEPQSIVSRFGSAAVGTDAAFSLNNDIIFVKGTICYRYDTSTGLMGGAHDFSQDGDFTKCSSSTSSSSSSSVMVRVTPLLMLLSLILKHTLV